MQTSQKKTRTKGFKTQEVTELLLVKKENSKSPNFTINFLVDKM